jgi:glycosyltransferase involved in cell wall biosynthesis
VIKVSVVVPVYNPGRNIDDCVRSIVHDQTLPADEYEAIFVDDGSTDETPARLDALAAEHSHVRVEHIPNSGWPGRPRNIGVDMARGEYVYFVDNDDWIGPEALERLYAAAQRDSADIVIGKVVGDGKYVPRGLFRENRTGVTIESHPITLVGLLTPHKLFRKALLDEHAIRFPEGRRRLEDHVFTLGAYFNARSITILADYPCYHWVLRKGDDNASYRPFEPTPYYENVREVLDLVEANTEPGPERERLRSHWYRGKMLGRVGGRYFPRRDPAYRRELYEEVRKLALERFDESIDQWLAPSFRVRSHLLREGDYDSLEALAAMEAELRTDVKAGPLRDELLPFEARLAGDSAPLRFRRDGDRVVWLPPEGVTLPDGWLDVTEAIDSAKVELTLRSTADRSEYVLPTEASVALEEAGDGALETVLRGEARVAPEATGGEPPAAGVWDALAVVTVAGFTATGRVRDARSAAPVRLQIDSHGRVARARTASLAGRAARRMPGLARVVRRALDSAR